jgi:tetratricopeptide (TPR) repeat protein
MVRGVATIGTASFMFAKHAVTASLLIALLTLARNQQPKPDSSMRGNEACASCHAEISKSYAKTSMAQASGPALEGVIAGEFKDKVSGVDYRIFQRGGRAWMSYERDGAPDVRGERELLYFIGSGRKGRTYLFSVDGYLFEAPINWYAQEERWNMTPAYIEAPEIPMNLPSFASCLNCHTSSLQPHISGTRNRYTGAPFLHDGITCERCHGAPNGHVSAKDPIVNPAKLPAERRDGICMECHFEGIAAIPQPGKHVEQFQPGEKLSDYLHYFVMAGNQAQNAEALSQFEALSLSVCKRQSGDKLWCGSCHDPHMQPNAEEKVAYYRSKCLNCHGEAFAQKHHANKPDCMQCHMPALPSKDVAHTQSTDHRILKEPQREQPVKTADTSNLGPFPQSAAPLVTDRDLALAWEQLARRGIPGASQKAEASLRKALTELPDDPSLLSAMGFEQQQRGHEEDAKSLYERTLKVRPTSNTAATNLGIMDAQHGDVRPAVELWQAAFQRVPYRSEIGMDLAMVFCAAGQKDEARRYVQRVLEFNPDYGKARQLLVNLGRDPAKCSP